jgi:hypothetical protein
LIVTVAVADFVGSTTLVARTVAVVGPLTAYGELYTPNAFTAPGPDTSAQVTAVLSVLLTVAVNCPVCDGHIAPGAATLTATGADRTIVTLADALLLGSATLVAIAVIVVFASTAVGGTYQTPFGPGAPELLKDPTDPGLVAHVTAVLPGLSTTVAFSSEL